MIGKVIPLHSLYPGSSAPLGDPSDAALLRACAQGDNDALAVLFDRHHRSVQRVLQHTFALAHADLEDILQEAFFEVHRKSDQFRGDASVRSWIVGIALNKARHHLRSTARRARLRSIFGEYVMVAPQRSSATPVAQLVRQENLGHLAAAVARLPEKQRVVFVMVDVEEFSGVDAAKALGLPEGTLYRRLHEARKALRKALTKEAPDG